MIRRAQPADIETIRELFREYAEWLGDAICFDSFARELAELPGRYAPLLIAFQGSGLGRALLEQVIAEAKGAGYRSLRLDTLPKMERAIALYRSFGFREIPPYGDNPPEAICFGLSLHSL